MIDKLIQISAVAMLIISIFIALVGFASLNTDEIDLYAMTNGSWEGDF